MGLLLTVHIFVTLILIGLILIQKSDTSGGLLGGGSSNSGMFTTRGAANFLTRLTSIFAAVFIGNCILMTILNNKTLRDQSSIVNSLEEEKTNKKSKDSFHKESVKKELKKEIK